MFAFTKNTTLTINDNDKFPFCPKNLDENKLLFKKYARNVESGKPTIVNKETFEKNFDIETSNLFLCMDWSNMVIAGGAVLALLTKEEIGKQDFSDFDIFLYGLTDRGYNRKVIEIYNALHQVYGKTILTVRTRRAITFVCGNGIRHIQVIIKDHNNIHDIIDSFDVDCCCVAYDGNNIHYVERFRDALTSGVNRLRFNLCSNSYEYRLSKYGRRGYMVYVDNLDINKVNNQIYSRPIKYQKGLSKLLSLEQLNTSTKYEKYCDIMDYFQASMRRNIALNADYKESSYDSTYMAECDKFNNINNYRDHCNKVNRDTKCRIFYIDDVNNVILGPKDKVTTKCEDSYTDANVNGRVSWITVDQDEDKLFTRFNTYTNTDHVDEWYDSAYLTNTHIDKILASIQENDVLTFEKLIPNTDLNVRNIVNRVPIHEAIIYRNFNMFQALHNNGASLTFVSKLKKTPIHTACEYNNMKIVKYILRNDSSALFLKDSYGLTPLLYTVVYGHFELFKYLYSLKHEEQISWEFKHDTKKNFGILEMCMTYKRYDIAKYLLDKGYDINDHRSGVIHIIIKCIKHNNLEFLKLLRNHKKAYNIRFDYRYIKDNLDFLLKCINTKSYKTTYVELAYYIITNIDGYNNKFDTLLTSVFKYSDEDRIKWFFTELKPHEFKHFSRFNFETMMNKYIDCLAPTTSQSKQKEYNIRFPSFNKDDYYPVPQWVIDGLVEEHIKNDEGVVTTVTSNKVQEHYINLRNIVISIINEESESDEKYEDEDCESESDEEDKIIKYPIKRVTMPKSIFVDEEDEEEDEEIFIKPPKKKLSSSYNKTFVNIDISTTSPFNVYMKFIDDIYNNNIEEYTNEKLEELNLTAKVNSSKYNVLSVAYNVDSSLYMQIVKTLVEQKNEEEKYKYQIKDYIIELITNSSKYHDKVFELLSNNERTNKYVDTYIVSILKSTLNEHEIQL